MHRTAQHQKMLHNIAQHCIEQHCTTKNCTAQNCTAQRCTAQNYTAQRCKAQHCCTAQCCIPLHNTSQYFTLLPIKKKKYLDLLIKIISKIFTDIFLKNTMVSYYYGQLVAPSLT